jgi:hypothetical protein
VKAAIDEHGLKTNGGAVLDNPFSGVRISGLGHDTTERQEFIADELRVLAKER